MSKKQVKKEELEKKKGKGKKIFIIILLIVFIPIILFFGYRFISNKLDDMNTKKMSNTVKEISKDKIDYVFIEINPSFVLTIKENKVTDIACLNDDCVSIYNDIDVKGKSIGESIDNLYNLAKEKGYDTSNGVKVKTTIEIDIKDKDYITVEFINETTKNELLSNVKNNEEIKNNSNDDYYARLWEELKKDKDYDKVYTCNMNDKELKCYIILQTGINNNSDYNVKDDTGLSYLQSIFNDSSNKIFNTLKKFNFNVKNNKVIINETEFGYVPLFTLNGTPYKNALTSSIIENLDNDICDQGYIEYENGKCQINDGVYLISLNEVNLVYPNSITDNMIIDKWNRAENIIENYETSNAFKKTEKEWNERVERCLPKIKAAGYYYKNDKFPCCDGTNEEQGCYSCSDKEVGARYCHIEHITGGVYAYIDGKEVLLDGDHESCNTLDSIFDELKCN